MGRILTVSRVTVRPEQEREYLATVQALATLAASRSQRIWVFRNSSKPHTYIEFSESPSRASHRARASRTADELKLEDKLRTLVNYSSDAWELWEEVAASQPLEAEGWNPDSESET